MKKKSKSNFKKFYSIEERIAYYERMLQLALDRLEYLEEERLWKETMSKKYKLRLK